MAAVGQDLYEPDAREAWCVQYRQVVAHDMPETIRLLEDPPRFGFNLKESKGEGRKATATAAVRLPCEVLSKRSVYKRIAETTASKQPKIRRVESVADDHPGALEGATVQRETSVAYTAVQPQVRLPACPPGASTLPRLNGPALPLSCPGSIASPAGG